MSITPPRQEAPSRPEGPGGRDCSSIVNSTEKSLPVSSLMTLEYAAFAAARQPL